MSSEQKLIALVGCPNAGKSALFNALTGGKQKVANYSGVTVEKKEGFFEFDGTKYRILDLPGIYSLKPKSEDEKVTCDVLTGKIAEVGRLPDLILCVLDSTNLKNHLRLAIELKNLGLPVIIALNMFDIAKRRGFEINIEALSKELGLPVVTTVAVRKPDIQSLLQLIAQHDSNSNIVVDHTVPTNQQLRQYHIEAQKILNDSGVKYGEPPVSTYKIDKFFLHPVFGLAILFVLLFLIFQAVFSWSAMPMDFIDASVAKLAEAVKAHTAPGLIQSFLVDGVIAGVGSVIIFLPQIIILYFFILLLEDSGYMARAAYMLDKIMEGSGLSGRSFIPLLSSFACAIPGIMATRTIPNKNDRLATIMIAPLMTCSARLPVYTLIISAFIPDEKIFLFNLQGVVMFGLYFSAILFGLLIAYITKRFFLVNRNTNFLMELPDYHFPYWKYISINLYDRAKIFLLRAGKVIFMVAVIIWLLSNFPQAPVGATEPAINYSLAGKIGKFIEPVFAPIGFNWEISIALIPGIAAREVVIAALGTVYALSDQGDKLENSLVEMLRSSWSLATALSFLAWYVFAPQCISTIAVIRRETNSWKWPAITVTYLFLLAYAAAYITYKLASN